MSSQTARQLAAVGSGESRLSHSAGLFVTVTEHPWAVLLLELFGCLCAQAWPRGQVLVSLNSSSSSVSQPVNASADTLQALPPWSQETVISHGVRPTCVQAFAPPLTAGSFWQTVVFN